jgi:hypothetical protein
MPATPPPVGQPFADARYGTQLRRITDAKRTPNAADGSGYLGWCCPDYATVSHWNLDNSKLFLMHQSYCALYSGAGLYLRDLPFAVNASSEPRWSRKSADLLYFLNGNKLMACSVGTGTTVQVHAFTEYSRISGKGEGDLAQDRDRLVLCGDDGEVFVYDAVADQRSAPLRTVGRALDSIYISPDGTQFTITWVGGGIDLFDWNAQLLRQLALSGSHMDMGRDSAGDSVLVRTNSNDNPPLANCPNGIEKVRLADGHKVCLLPLDWILAVHVSCSDIGNALVETYAAGNPAKQYANELVLIPSDGSGARSLCQHHSDVADYMGMPLASISRDGRRAIFRSNWGDPTPNYGDVYMMDIAGTMPSPQPVPPPAPTPDPPAPPAPPAPMPTTSSLITTIRAIFAFSPQGSHKHSPAQWTGFAQRVLPNVQFPDPAQFPAAKVQFQEWVRQLVNKALE